ncbi:MAG: prepilin peptidase [Desulfobacterales bacterium]|jgi:preprotein translocase subunit SecA
MRLPAQDYQTTRTATPGKLPRGLDLSAYKILGHLRRREGIRRRWLAESEQILEQSLQHQLLSDSDLKGRLNDSRVDFRRQKQGHEQRLPEALALIVEAASRCLGMRPFVVQILGAISIYYGYLAEMATGEGKSLTACLPAALAGWSGKPCHIVTANDYLAERDAEAFTPLYEYCGLSTGWVDGGMTPAERKENYQKGIVYTTSKELLADFLRDRLALGNAHQSSRRQIRIKRNPYDRSYDNLVMRGIDTAIIDEADSVLIDEAVTPLIISQAYENASFSEACQTANQIAHDLVPEMDYRIDRRYREIILTESGIEKIAEMSATLADIFQGSARREELVLTALTAKVFYQRNKQYVVEKDKVVIVDEFTGRMMPQRTWRHGLHQSIEALEGLPLSDPSETLARLSFQRFFRFFRKLGGMSGTAREAADEFWHIYELPVLSVPTNKPCVRKIMPSRFYPDQQSKWQAICNEVSACQETGQPVLIGTRSVGASETVAGLLKERNIPYQLLNAVNHREEAKIIASAGQADAVTIATNMAGRGADIKLGKGVAELGGLHVVVSERHESGRIDRQLYGRCARQGQPGSVRTYGSLEDELVLQYGPKPLLKLVSRTLSKNRPESTRLVEHLISLVQQKAQRQAFRQRKFVMQNDDWLTDALSFARSEIEQ